MQPTSIRILMLGDMNNRLDKRDRWGTCYARTYHNCIAINPDELADCADLKGCGFKRPINEFINQNGQTLPLLAAILIVIAILAGVIIDAGLVASLKIAAENDAATACVDMAEAAFRGNDPYTAAGASLASNLQPQYRWAPYAVGDDGVVVRGFQAATGGYRVALKWDQPVWFLNLVGIQTAPISARARCIGPEARLTPIAVRMSAVEHSLEGGAPEAYTILGNDPKWDLADEESGTNFRGAVLVHMRCKSQDGVPVTNCPDVDVYDPLTEPPSNPQAVKDLAEDCFAGVQCGIVHPSGTHIPIVSGTSDKQLVKAFCSPGCAVGTKVVVMIFDGEVYDPDPTYGNWENIKVVGYAVYEITDTSANAIEARLFSGPFSNFADLDVTTSAREISWTP
jgi:hypothetical protein